MYHDVYDKNYMDSGFINSSAIIYKIKINNFETQVKLIKNALKKKFIPLNYVQFTFDDGGESCYTNIAPILEKYGFKGYFFIITDLIEKKGFLTINQIQKLDKKGHIIGAHSHTHPLGMNKLSLNELKFEWEKSYKILSEILNKKILYASIPGGSYSKDVIKSMYDCGFRRIYTSNPNEKIRVFHESLIFGRFGIKKSMSNEFVKNIVVKSRIRIIIKIRKKTLKIIKFILGDLYFSFRNKILNNK